MTSADDASTLSPVSDAEAPPQVAALFDTARDRLGFVPNIYRMMANEPALFETYIAGYGLFRTAGTFTPPEQETVFLAISRDNGCPYCVAAHGWLAEMRSGLAPEVAQAIRDGGPIADPRLAALRDFTHALLVSRGRPTPAEQEHFFAAGFEGRHALAIVLALALKTMSNYTHHLAHPVLDDTFAPWAWSPSPQP